MNIPFNDRRRSSRRSSEILQSYDIKIMKACNELIEERTKSAKQRAQHSTELAKFQRLWEEKHSQYIQRLKPPKSNPKKQKQRKSDSSSSGHHNHNHSSFDLYQEAIIQVFATNKTKNENDETKNQNDVEEEEEEDDDNDETETHTMSPFLQSRLVSLCQHVHIMTLGEGQINKIHNDTRRLVNWLYESIEEMEHKKNNMIHQIQILQTQRKKLEQLVLQEEEQELVLDNNNNNEEEKDKNKKDNNDDER